MCLPIRDGRDETFYRTVHECRVVREEGGGGADSSPQEIECTTGGSGSGDGTLRKLGTHLARRTVRMDGVV